MLANSCEMCGVHPRDPHRWTCARCRDAYLDQVHRRINAEHRLPRWIDAA